MQQMGIKLYGTSVALGDCVWMVCSPEHGQVVLDNGGYISGPMATDPNTVCSNRACGRRLGDEGN